MHCCWLKIYLEIVFFSIFTTEQKDVRLLRLIFKSESCRWQFGAGSSVDAPEAVPQSKADGAAGGAGTQTVAVGGATATGHAPSTGPKEYTATKLQARERHYDY